MQTITSCLRIKETAATSASSQRQRKREEFSLIILDPVPRGKSLRINSTSVKEQVYKASVRLLEVPMLSLGPQHQQNITRLEAVQCRSLVSQVGCVITKTHEATTPGNMQEDAAVKHQTATLISVGSTGIIIQLYKSEEWTDQNMETSVPTSTIDFINSVIPSHLTSLTASDLGFKEETEEDQYQRELQRQMMEGSPEALKCMIEKGLQWNRELTKGRETPVHAALKQKDHGLLETLLLITDLVHVPSASGETPIHLACKLGLEDAVCKLLAAGADVNARDSKLCTPVFHAVQGKHLSCVKLLVKAGCDLDWVNFDLYAPMDHALRHSDHDMVALLLRAGCCTQELRGQTYWCEDRSKSFFHALCSDTTLDNVRLYLDCGYAVPDSEMSSLKILSQMLSADPREKGILDMLTEFTEKPKSLMWRCRQMVRQLLMETRWRQHTPMEAMIASLPLPSQLKEFLSLTPPPTQL